VLYCRGTRPSQAPKVAAALEGFARTYGGDHGGRDDRPNARDAHKTLAVRLTVTDLLDLAGERLDTLVEPEPVLVEPDDEIAHAR
jgi:hypothetical protein